MGPPEGGGEGGPQLRLARSLQEILNLFNPANNIMGDAVYSQEALDRIITQLMEANPQSNAAPPATEAALDSLERRTVDKELVKPDDKVECSICIDEMEQGDTAAFLPCRHWFHERCVVLWLKEHNTCPVCRTPIEKEESSTGGPETSGPSSNPLNAQSSVPSTSFSRHNSDQSRGFGSGNDGGADTPTGRAAADMVSSVNLDSQPRPSNPSQSRLNEALRSVANIQRDRDGDGRHRATASGFSYDTSRLQRRTSHSPTSPRATNLSEQGARMRQRSPSEGDRRGNGEREPRRHSGAFGWFRDRFTGGNGNGGNQESREERQP